nr:MAG TPA: hypothetical protein [Caudoviricetes sp.]
MAPPCLLHQSVSGVRRSLRQKPHCSNIHIKDQFGYLTGLLVFCVFDSLGMSLICFNHLKKHFVCSVHFSPSFPYDYIFHTVRVCSQIP